MDGDATKTSDKGCLRGVLIGCGIVLLIAVVGAVALMGWVRSNKGEIKGAIDRTTAEADSFAATTDQRGCYEEGKRRAAAGGGLPSMIRNSMFVQQCLDAARETPGFCANIPPSSAISRSATWQNQECGSSQGCRAILSGVQSFCEEHRRRAEFPAESLPAPDTTWRATEP